MCGLFALVNWATIQPDDHVWASRARERLRLRGPDHQATLTTDDSLCLFAHTRLAIIDPQSVANQPMFDPETGVGIVYNGEIYNFPELRRGLIDRGVTLRTNCDTEVILKLYIEGGSEALRRLRGMYAFTIWDPRAQRLVAARDPFGIKPLYVWRSKDRVAYASQVKALACGLPDAGQSAEAVLEYALFGHIFSPETPVQGVSEVEPGAIEITSVSGAERAPARRTLRELFEIEPAPTGDETEIADAVEESVMVHTLSDVPIGVLLSAGVDSSLVASRLAAGLDAGNVNTFTIGFGSLGGKRDESSRASQIAGALGFPNTSEVISDQAIEAEMRAYLDAMDQPTVDAINTYFAARLVARHKIKVALVGTGGDELFGGYPSFRRAPLMVSPVGRLSVWGGAAAASIGLRTRSFNVDKLGWMRRSGRDLAGAFLVLRGLASPPDVARTYDCSTAQANAVFERVRGRLSSDLEGIEDSWSSISYLETRFYLMPRLLRDADWAGMAHSVELRTPLVDWALWERARPALSSRKLRRGRSKRELVEPALAPAVRALLAGEKLGFGNPYESFSQFGGQPAARGGSAQQNWARFVLDSWSRSLGNNTA